MTKRLILLFFLLAACSSEESVPLPTLIVTSTSTIDQDAGAVARVWLDAALKNDGIVLARYTCTQVASDLSQSGMWMNVFSLAANELVPGIADLEVQTDLTSVNFSVLTQDENTAQVLVGGTLHIAVGGMFDSVDLTETMSMIREDGYWKYCPQSSTGDIVIPQIPPGATLSINTLEDTPSGCPQTCSLRSAIAAAQPGDILQFEPTLTGTLHLAQPLVLDKSLRIVGTGSDKITLLAQATGSDPFSIITVQESAVVTLHGLTLTSGQGKKDYGGAITNYGALKLEDITLTDNKGDWGNSIFNTGTLIMEQSAILNGQALQGVTSYSSLYNDRGAVKILDSIFDGNKGGIESQGGIIHIERSLFTNHIHDAVLYAWLNTSVTLIDSTIEGNEIIKPYGSPGIVMEIEGSVTVQNSRIKENTGSCVLYVKSADEVRVENSFFASNQSDCDGGALAIVDASNLTITGSTFHGNQSGG
ncbi:MAG: right-handed parallel beta-helix repeat-containing protein, partial [Anaerolineae bacterium]|nr:right-handed parallel beta-helix repeat-containing protein [Anaerolineae bacterium]